MAVPVTLSAYSRPAFCEPQALGARGIIVEDVLLKSVKLPDQLTRVRTIHLCNTCACVCLLLHRHVASPRHPARTWGAEYLTKHMRDANAIEVRPTTSQVVYRNASACVT